MNIRLTDIIELAKLNDKEKLKIAADLMLQVACNLPDAAMLDQEYLNKVQEKIRSIA